MDGSAEKYISLSSYHYVANNPILNFDIDGNEFTQAAWDWVNHLIDEIERREEKNNADIASKEEEIASGNLSERQVNRRRRQVERLRSRNQRLNNTRAEIGILASSNQVYNVVSSSRLNEAGPVHGMGTVVAATSFNFETGAIDITISSNAGLDLFAHELKHAYQFEIGESSFGQLGGLGVAFLHDKHDEAAGFQRQELFGRIEYGENTVEGLSERYNGLPEGPNSVHNNQYIQNALRFAKPTEIQKILTNISRQAKQAFRLNGITYY